MSHRITDDLQTRGLHQQGLFMQKIIRSLWMIAFLIPVLTHAAAKEPFKEGQDYRLLKSPVQTSASPGRVEVAEVFWYGCPHCYSLESAVHRWEPTMAKEAQLVRVPGFFGPNVWQTHAQLYYTLESLFPNEKELYPVHDAVFREIQEGNNRLTDEKDMAEYLSKNHNVDKDKFLSYYKSFGVHNLLNQAFSKVRGYQLTGVPALVVDGRYVIEPKIGLEKMTQVADYLIRKVSDGRAEVSPEAKKDTK